jgi:hypothetical protein
MAEKDYSCCVCGKSFPWNYAMAVRLKEGNVCADCWGCVPS